MLGGRYTLLDELGRGGMAVVWRARDEVLGRSVAVKLLAGRHAGDPQSRARIRDEARAAATLSHPNIAQVYDFGESDQDGRLVPYVVMELVHGITLQQRMRAGTLPPGLIFRIGAQVAAALAAAHADGLVHRDIKPGNVMVTAEQAKVVDFGLAAVAGPANPEDALMGTPAYLAPERLTGGPVVPASDVYALGVLMYRLLAGGSPWTVDSTTQMLSAHVYVEPTPLPRADDVPLQVTDLVNACLRKGPGERPTAAQVSATLTRAAEQAAATQSAALTATTPSDRKPATRAERKAAAEAERKAAAGAEPKAVTRAERRAAAEAERKAGAGGGAERKAAAEAGAGAGAERKAAAKVGQKTATGAERSAALAAIPKPRTPATPEASPARQRKQLILGGVAAAIIAAVLLAIFLPDADGPERNAEVAATGPSAISGRSATGAAPDGPAPTATRPAVAGTEQQPGAGSSVRPPAADPVAPSAGVRPSSAPAPRPTPTGEPSATQPASGGRTFTSVGGTVEAKCDSAGKAALTSWTPADPYKVQKVDEGPALTAAIVFRKPASRIRMTVTCVAGTPSVVTLPL